MNRQNKESLLSPRGQMAFCAIGLWFFLAAWSLSAFWQHIDTLNPTYRFASLCGAAGGEFALLIFIALHCFNKHIGVRKWALILGFVLAAVIAAHSGALRGLNEAEVKQADTEQRLRESLTLMSKEQAASIAETNAKTSAGLRQKERLAMAGKTKAAEAEIAKSAQQQLGATIISRAERVKESSIFPRWYLDGWMYSVIFILSLAFSAFIFRCMMNSEDIDANFDGIPDHLQSPARSAYAVTLSGKSSGVAPLSPAPAQANGEPDKRKIGYLDSESGN